MKRSLKFLLLSLAVCHWHAGLGLADPAAPHAEWTLEELKNNFKDSKTSPPADSDGKPATPPGELSSERKQQLIRSLNACGIRVNADTLDEEMDKISGRRRPLPGPLADEAEGSDDADVKRNPTGEGDAPANTPVTKILNDINKHRAEMGLPELKVDAQLTEAARKQRDFLIANPPSDPDRAHDGPRGINQWERARQAAFVGKTSESIFLRKDNGPGWTPEQVVPGIKSLKPEEGHRQDMESSEFDSIGIAPSPAGSNGPIVIVYGKRRSPN